MAKHRDTPADPPSMTPLQLAEAALARARLQRAEVARLADKAEAGIGEAAATVRKIGEALGTGDTVTASLHDDAVLAYIQAEERAKSYRKNVLPAAEEHLKRCIAERDAMALEADREAIRSAVLEKVLPADAAVYEALDAAAEALAAATEARSAIQRRFPRELLPSNALGVGFLSWGAPQPLFNLIRAMDGHDPRTMTRARAQEQIRRPFGIGADEGRPV